MLDLPVAHEPAVALVVGYDYRFGDDPNASRSDTLMLIRADPDTKSISMLSFPRDLLVDVYCPGAAPVRDRINSAYSRCGIEGHARDRPQADGPPDPLPDHRSTSAASARSSTSSAASGSTSTAATTTTTTAAPRPTSPTSTCSPATSG